MTYDPRTYAAIHRLSYFACLVLLGLVGRPRAEMYNERTARLAVIDKYQAMELSDAAIMEATELG